MKKLARTSIFILVTVLMFTVNARADKNYTIGPVHIDARLEADGSLLVEERRNYDFSGAFHYAFRSLPLREGILYSDFAVLEGDQAYVERPDEEPGSFSARQEKGALEVRWFFSARNEARTFIFRYRVTGAVTRYADAAVFYYKFIGQDWSKKQDEVTLTVDPPQEKGEGEVLHWLHGPLWARSAIQPSGRITATCAELPARVYLELRALYPSEWFGGLPLMAGSVRSGILAEEARWATEANQMREREKASQKVRGERRVQGRYYAGLLALVGIGAWWLFFRQYGKHPLLHDFIPNKSLKFRKISRLPWSAI